MLTNNRSTHHSQTKPTYNQTNQTKEANQITNHQNNQKQLKVMKSNSQNRVKKSGINNHKINTQYPTHKHTKTQQSNTIIQTTS